MLHHYVSEPFDLKCLDKEEGYDRLTNRVVEWYRHYTEPIHHEGNLARRRIRDILIHASPPKPERT
jgi:hypothetical protein